MNTLYEEKALLKASLVLSVPTEVGQPLECCSSRSNFSNRHQDTQAVRTNKLSTHSVKGVSKRTARLVLLRLVACIVHTRKNCDGPAPIANFFISPDFRREKVKYRFSETDGNNASTHKQLRQPHSQSTLSLQSANFQFLTRKNINKKG